MRRTARRPRAPNKAWPSATHRDSAARVTALRRALQACVCLPIDGVDALWREYDAFERGESEQLAKQLLDKLQPAHANARAAARRRRDVWGSVDGDLSQGMARPPQSAMGADGGNGNEHDGGGADDQMLRRWRRVLTFERALAVGGGAPGIPAVGEPLDPTAAHRCQLYAYRAALGPLRHYPEARVPPRPEGAVLLFLRRSCRLLRPRPCR